jgi:hypothetical protein
MTARRRVRPNASRRALSLSDDLARYLLNEPLDRSKVSEIEKRLNVDDDLVEEAQAVEDELIVQYATQRLSPARKKQFERYFLTSSGKRQRLRFVQLMIDALRGSPAPNDGSNQKTLRVFLSSTQADLTDERTVALNVITRMQLRHGSMEFFGARQDLPLETCLQEVRRCDIFILLIGSRYGHVAKKMVRSFTELEYREAYRLGKDCLIYCRDQRARLLPAQMEQNGKNLERLRAFKTLLSSRHTLAPFVDLHDLAAMVAADLANKLISATQPRPNSIQL